jgi:EAL domain-containing protein (putative c-di-GMP-specific phosphodiesterase class I)
MRSCLIVQIGDWVLRNVCRNIAQWDADGLCRPMPAADLTRFLCAMAGRIVAARRDCAALAV